MESPRTKPFCFTKVNARERVNREDTENKTCMSTTPPAGKGVGALAWSPGRKWGCR